jgi:alkanesulfonate monooxygenase SsuD/methylene tetrahydromethanopterin reductase-like flavin-dependent oxidoreductase (luciferase family)
MFPRSEEIRAAHPVLNDNPLKLGLFSINWTGAAHTYAPGWLVPTWQNSLAIAKAADRAGFEAIIPVSRYKSLIPGKPEHRSGMNLETFTWGAGLAASTQYTSIFVTAPLYAFHPVLAAKQGATVDQIAGGRFGLNVVAGWNVHEAAMFGAQVPDDHDRLYAKAAEFMEIVLRAWSSEDEFDFHGDFYDVAGVYIQPRPSQAPWPIIANAGGSSQGRNFAAQYADMAFVSIKSDDPAAAAAMVEDYRNFARTTHGREISVWTHGYVVQGDTDDEAVQIADSIYEQGDFEAVDSMMAGLVATGSSGLTQEEYLASVRRHFVLGSSGFPLVGSPQTIADRLEMLSNAGIDGVLLTWVDYLAGMERFNAEVLPMLEERGLRAPFTPAGDVAAGAAAR